MKNSLLLWPLLVLAAQSCASTEYEAPALTYGAKPSAALQPAATPGDQADDMAEGTDLANADTPADMPGETSMEAAMEAAMEPMAPTPAKASTSEAAFVINPDAPNATELTVWNSPAFKRQFALSFTAETDIEPKLLLPEIEELQKVQAMIASDRGEEAIQLLESRTTSASSATYDFTLANLYFQREELDKAEPAYVTATEKFPKFQRAWKNLGLVHFRNGDFEQAQVCLSRVIELGGGDGETYGMLGVAYTNGGNALSAESCFRMATILAPTNDQWKMGLARSFFTQGRYADAASLCGYMIERAPDRADLWMLQANAFLALGKTIDAAQNFELVDRMGASTAESLALLGDIYAQDELFDLAAASYVRALNMSGADGATKALRNAKVLTSRGATEEAKRVVETLAESFGASLNETDQKDMLRLRARITVAQGAGEEEALVLKEILEIDPLDGDALILLGQHSRRSGDVEQAIFYFERAAGIEGFEAEALVRHAQAVVSQGNYSAALPLLRRAQQIDPRDNIQEYLEQVERVALGR